MELWLWVELNILIITIFYFITKQNKKNMGKLDELKEEVTKLQATVDAEQAQIAALLESNAATVTALNKKITDLEAAAANSATPEQLQEIIDGLKAVSADVATTVADAPETPEETPANPE